MVRFDTSVELTQEIFELNGGTPHQYEVVGNWTLNYDTGIVELALEIFELKARHGGTPHPRGKLLRDQVGACFQLQPKRPGYYIDPQSLPLLPYIPPNSIFLPSVDFLNRLTILNLRLCKRFKSIDELPISLKAMDANNTISLEWIIAGSNWKLSKRLECFGSSKLLQKNPTGNPRKKLIKVSLSLSLEV